MFRKQSSEKRVTWYFHLLLTCFIFSSCSDKGHTDIQVIESTAEYNIEMDGNFRVSRYSFQDANESYSGDMDCISEYTYYSDSIIIITDSRSVTARGDYSKAVYYLNSQGLADSSYHEIDPGHLAAIHMKHFYKYDSGSYLTVDSSLKKEQGLYALNSVTRCEYADGNLIEQIDEYYGSLTSVYTYTFDYNTSDNLFSLFGTFKGKISKNLVSNVTTHLLNGETSVASNEYKLYPDGLIEEVIYRSASNTVSYTNTIRYTYTITGKSLKSFVAKFHQSEQTL